MKPIRFIKKDGVIGLLYLGDAPDRFSDQGIRVFVVHKSTCIVRIVRGHIEVTMPGAVEQDRLLFPGLLALQRLVNSASHRMGRLGGNDDPFRS